MRYGRIRATGVWDSGYLSFTWQSSINNKHQFNPRGHDVLLNQILSITATPAIFTTIRMVTLNHFGFICPADKDDYFFFLPDLAVLLDTVLVLPETDLRFTVGAATADDFLTGGGVFSRDGRGSGTSARSRRLSVLSR